MICIASAELKVLYECVLSLPDLKEHFLLSQLPEGTSCCMKKLITANFDCIETLPLGPYTINILKWCLFCQTTVWLRWHALKLNIDSIVKHAYRNAFSLNKYFTLQTTTGSIAYLAHMYFKSKILFYKLLLMDTVDNWYAIYIQKIIQIQRMLFMVTILVDFRAHDCIRPAWQLEILPELNS